MRSLRFERAPGEGNGSPLQYYCQGNSMDRGIWRATVHGSQRIRNDLTAKQQQYSIVYMHHNFFIHLSVTGHLGCFHVLAIKEKKKNQENYTHTHTHTHTYIYTHIDVCIYINIIYTYIHTLLLLLLSRFSRVWLCATPQTAAHQASLSLGFSRQEHWSGLPFPSPMHESEK